VRYIGRRLPHGAFVLLGVSVWSFVLIELAPISPESVPV
jgi:hypothetical protein